MSVAVGEPAVLELPLGLLDGGVGVELGGVLGLPDVGPVVVGLLELGGSSLRLVGVPPPGVVWPGLPGCGWPGWGCPGCGGAGGTTTVVVSWPSAPRETTVVGALDDDELPGTGSPVTVIGAPGTGEPDTTWMPAGEVPWPGPPVPPAVVVPEPANCATAANAVATTRPLTPRTT
ncbi:hypothetical protein ACFWY9_39125 [Amycolatopsis sp. NPDC059027]|uniref:hypothetical protein n=1 Tax=unclassified Amycolatopsis TaxID=2618356 RepID=UPI0036727C3E